MLSDNPNNAIYLGPAGSEVFRFSCRQSEKLEKLEKLVASEQNLVALVTPAVATSSSAMAAKQTYGNHVGVCEQ